MSDGEQKHVAESRCFSFLSPPAFCRGFFAILLRMKKNVSPWLHQLDTERVEVRLKKDLDTDVAIVGAGIAGVATAFYVLKRTKQKVALVDAYRLAHGATGHNAGQVVSYFERGFARLADEFGLELAADGQRSVEDAWELLEEMYADAALSIPFSHFLGHAGLSSEAQVLNFLRSSHMRRKAGLSIEQMRISQEAPFLATIPSEYQELYSVVAPQEISETLETTSATFVAVVSYKKGCINSALFCQEVVLYLQKQYPERFALFEHSPVKKIILHEDHALLDATVAVLKAARVVLCTNGFEGFHILNKTGLGIDARYHHEVSGKVGYMSGYLEKANKAPIAISYLTDPRPGPDNSYYYLTRRPFEYEKGSKYNLVSIGGPDMDLEEYAEYSHEVEYPDAMEKEIDAFVRSVYDTEPNKKIDYAFTWHGLMGYTRNGVRMIGPEPQNPVLLYNLGCNGIGILPSLYGGKKIAAHIAGASVAPTIFDVPIQKRTVEGIVETSSEDAPRYDEVVKTEPVLSVLDHLKRPREFLRALYRWMVGWADSPFAERALGLIAFVESSVFPIPPDPLLIAMSTSAPKRHIRFAFICTLASVLGGLFGYGIGAVLFESIGRWVVDTYGLHSQFSALEARYAANAFFTVFIAAFTPVPYKLITIAAGVFSVNIPVFIVASLIGRGARFFIVAELASRLGRRYKDAIERSVDILSLAFVTLIILGFLILR